jgi:hypothetical protein
MQLLHERLPSRDTPPSHLKSSTLRLRTNSSTLVPRSSQPVLTTSLSSMPTPASPATMNIPTFVADPSAVSLLQAIEPLVASQYADPVLFTFHVGEKHVTVRQKLLAKCSKLCRRTYPVEEQEPGEVIVEGWPFAVVVGYVAFVDGKIRHYRDIMNDRPPGTTDDQRADHDFVWLASIFVFAIQMEDLATQLTVMQVMIHAALVPRSDGRAYVPRHNAVNIIYNGTQAQPNALRDWLVCVYVAYGDVGWVLQPSGFHNEFWINYVKGMQVSRDQSLPMLRAHVRDVDYWISRRRKEIEEETKGSGAKP